MVRRLPDAERGTYEKLGYAQTMGSRPALLIIDCTYGFTGSKPMPLEQAAEEFPTSCGESAWAAMPAIRLAAGQFRELGLPGVYTVQEYKQEAFDMNAKYASVLTWDELAPSLSGMLAKEIDR